MARHHGWAVIAAAALKSENFKDGDDLSALLGDERVPYEADRVLVVQRSGEVRRVWMRSTRSHHAQRSHRSAAPLADAVLGRTFLSRPRSGIPQTQSNGTLMTDASSLLLTFLREAWMALAGCISCLCSSGRHRANAAREFCQCPGRKPVGMGIHIRIVIHCGLGLFAFLGIPQIVSALQSSLPGAGGCGPISELGTLASGLIGGLAALRMLKAAFTSMLSASIGGSSSFANALIECGEALFGMILASAAIPLAAWFLGTC